MTLILVAITLTLVVFVGPQGGAVGGLLCLWAWIYRRTTRKQRELEEDEAAYIRSLAIQRLGEGDDGL